MAVQFILGSPGTGKTVRVLQEIKERLSGGVPLYYLVPEQFSLQSERLLLERLDQAAATQVQVLSFNRLGFRLFAALGGPCGQLVGDLGKQMLLRKVLFEIADDLVYYKSAADKHGFVQELSHTITELNHYRVSAGELYSRAEDSEPMLAAKLRDTALLLTKYREMVKNQYLLTDEMLTLLCQKLDDCSSEPLPLLDGAFFWADGFSGFTPQERQVLLHIMKRAARLTLTLNDLVSSAPRDTMEKIEKLAGESRVPVLPNVYMKENHRHVNSPGLAHLAKHFGSNYRFPEKPGDIEIISAHDKYSSVYAAAELVLHLVRQGFRFRDIAILCGDRTYEKILQTVFDRLNIPLFVDTETDILSHPLTELVRAALDIPVRNRNYESVFRFLKTRLAGISPDTVDVLENYVLANGISSYRWQYPFTDESAEAGRVQFLSALKIYEKTRAATMGTVKAHSHRVFDMLYALAVPETLQRWFDESRAGGDHAAARMHGQIWPKLCEVFDKLVEILGDEEVSHKTFAATLDAGLSQVGLGRIPPTTDQIILGDLRRSRYPEIKAMLVLGANENVLPPPPAGAGLFTDYERVLLCNSALELAPENRREMSEQTYNLYCAISQPKEKLSFIYALSEPDGKPLRPSPFLNKIRELFPRIETAEARSVAEFEAIESGISAPAALSPETAAGLYGHGIVTAATRLEAFARCPFAYFMANILGAKPRKHYEVLPADLGSLFHEILAGFARRVWGENQPDSPLTLTEISSHIDELVRETAPSDLFESTARNRHILNKVRRAATASCWALNEYIRRGEYQPAMTEHEISSGLVEDGLSMTITGRVDRVDIREAADGHEYVKIIDYKSGRAKFSADEARRGVQLQLMLYMNALIKAGTAAGKPSKPGGMFYFPIDDPILDTDEQLDDAAREEGLLKCFKMSGLEIGDDFEIDDFNQLSQEVEDKVKEIGRRMTRGEIVAVPYTKGRESVCRFCLYGVVCGK